MKKTKRIQSYTVPDKAFITRVYINGREFIPEYGRIPLNSKQSIKINNDAKNIDYVKISNKRYKVVLSKRSHLKDLYYEFITASREAIRGFILLIKTYVRYLKEYLWKHGPVNT